MLRKLFWKIIPPYEVTVVKREIQQFLEEDDGLSRDAINSLVQSYLRRNPQAAVDAIRIEHVQPEHYALALIGGILKIQLVSGQHHSYRGVLGIIGADMKRVWEKVTDRLVDRGYVDTETAQEVRMDLHDEIKSIG